MHIPDAPQRKNLISLTSLIDVVFILLVFFMLSTNFLNWNSIALGTAQESGQTEKVQEQSLIYVDFNQQYKLNEKQMPLAEIVSSIKVQFAKDSSHPILIQPVGDLPIQELIDVIDIVGEISKKNISLVKVDK